MTQESYNLTLFKLIIVFVKLFRSESNYFGGYQSSYPSAYSQMQTSQYHGSYYTSPSYDRFSNLYFPGADLEKSLRGFLIDARGAPVV